MADQKLTALPKATTAADDDLIYIVTDPSGTPASEGIEVTDLVESRIVDTSRQYTKGQGLTNVVLSISTSVVALDLSLGNSFTLDMDEDAELSLPTVDRPQGIQIKVFNNGGFTLTFESGYKVIGDTPSTTDTEYIYLNIACYGDNTPLVVVNSNP